MNEKIILIDGHSILNRAFYGIPNLSNSSGFPTNAIYGFLTILFKLIEDEKPNYLIVAFDVKEKTFRHEMYADYKGTRKPMPEELREQVPVMKEVLKAMGILVLEKAGLEADDILGTIAKRSEKEGLEVTILSGDRDLLQIASEHIKIRIPKTRGGKTEIEDYYAKDVLDTYQVTPLQFIELKALMGDTADNIPGVPKVGEKTATELMVTYGSIDGIYQHIEEITKKSIKASLVENRELADLSKRLATIEIDASISYSLQEAYINNLFTKDAYHEFQRLGFKNLLSKFSIDEVAEKEIEENQYHILHSVEELRMIEKEATDAELFAYYFVCEKEIQESIGLAMVFSDKVLYVSRSESIGYETIVQVWKNIVIQRIEKGFLSATYAIKPSFQCFDTEITLDASNHFFDILIASYLINPLNNDYQLEDIANEYLEQRISSKTELFGKKKLNVELEDAESNLAQYACIRANIIYQVTPILQRRLQEEGMLDLFQKIETPLSFVLSKMEKEGILVQAEELERYSEMLAVRINELEISIFGEVGEEFNLNSPKQLGEILFVKLQLPGGKKTKTGYSTAADVLEKLAIDYPIVSQILEYRALTKLKSTYADGLHAYIESDHRIHTNFNQTITATGRISSTEPNLQNIPMKTELGRKIRKAFIPKEGYVFVDADYSQIELRILAHLSGDEKLIEAYQNEEDIHRLTASEVFHTPFDEVTDLQRRNAKAVNFGIVYGISSFSLSQDLSISKKEAAEYIEQYFKTYPKVKLFLETTVEEAKENAYVKTIFGRKRPIPELKSSNFMQRSFGERVAMNSPIQGSAADIMKIAMIEVYRALENTRYDAKIILQIHDELLLEVKREQAEDVKEMLEQKMQDAVQFAVPFAVDAHIGNDWYDVK